MTIGESRYDMEGRVKIGNLDDLLAFFREHASGRYGLSDVNQMQHALQSAHLAETRGATPALVLACLFHDIGHFRGRQDDALAERGVDDLHEVAGARLLAKVFGSEVAEPVSLHVTAKRYLCTIDPGYYGRLSADSVRSLDLQGGVMNDGERRNFESEPYSDDAIFLRKCDEDAKDPAAQVPELDHYVETARSLARIERALQ